MYTIYYIYNVLCTLYYSSRYRTYSTEYGIQHRLHTVGIKYNSSPGGPTPAGGLHLDSAGRVPDLGSGVWDPGIGSLLCHNLEHAIMHGQLGQHTVEHACIPAQVLSECVDDLHIIQTASKLAIFGDTEQCELIVGASLILAS